MAFSVKSTRKAAPFRAVIHGPGGVGKSTFASHAPSPVFVAIEHGLNNIEAVAVEPYPCTWEDVLAAIKYVATLDYETLVIDSLDWLEPLCWDFTVRSAKSSKIRSIEDIPYGNGYKAASSHWRILIDNLEELGRRGMNVILIAHSARMRVKNPSGEDYERWGIKLHEKAAGITEEWADVIGFADHDITTDDSEGRVKAHGTGRRVLRTHPNPAYTAKTRYAMPPKLPLDWDAFAHAIRGGDLASVLSLQGELERRIAELGDAEVEGKVRAFVKERGESMQTLTEAVERLGITLEERRKSA